MADKKFLRQAGTGDFYPWTIHLSQRPDMVEVAAKEVPIQFGGTNGTIDADKIHRDRMAEIEAAAKLLAQQKAFDAAVEKKAKELAEVAEQKATAKAKA